MTALVAVSVVLLVFNDNPQIRFIRSLTVGTLGAVQQTFSFLPNLSALRAENELLRSVNATLADEVNQLREARLEAIRLRSLIALKETSSVPLTAGRIVAKNLNLLRNTITIDAGEDRGVLVGNPIVTGEAMLWPTIVSSSSGTGQAACRASSRSASRKPLAETCRPLL